jgi:hypothetical protein
MIGVDIVESFRLGTDKSLDARYVVNSYYDVSSYWYPGMPVFQQSDNQFYWYDGSTWILKVNQSLFDSSISSLTIKNNNQDISINDLRIYVDGSLNLKINKSGDIMSGNLIIQTDLSVNGKGIFGNLNVGGTIFPSNPSDGDQFYRKDQGLWYVYDSSRGKYLSPRQTLTCGRTSAVSGSTVYMRNGDATQSSLSGLKMYRNGTITSFSVQNSTTLTANRLFQIRVNDVSTLTTTILSGNTGANYTNGNADFNAGDLIQAAALPGGTGSALNNIIVVIEIAWRV